MTSHAPSRLLTAFLTTLGVAAVLLVGPGAGGASAYHYENGGRVGSVSVPAVVGTHYRQCQTLNQWLNGQYYSYQQCYWNPVLQLQAETIGRSPATSGAQNLRRAVHVYRYDSGWRMITGSDRTWRIPSGTSRISLPQTWAYPRAAGYLKVVMFFTWTNANTGATLAVKKLSFDQRYDYSCATQFPCQAHQGGYVWLRHP